MIVMPKWSAAKGVCGVLLLLNILSFSCKKKETDTRIKAVHPINLVLDAAHGGSDTGVVSVSGITEKEIVLLLCNKIAAIAPEYNITVLLTRTEDKDVPGEERVAYANANTAAAFIAVHINKSKPTKPVDGYEIFVSGANAKYNESTRLKDVITSRLTEAGIKVQYTEKGVYVLEQCKHPAIAIECGDIDNSPDVARIMEGDKLETLCRNMLEGLVIYANGK